MKKVIINFELNFIVNQIDINSLLIKDIFMAQSIIEGLTISSLFLISSSNIMNLYNVAFHNLKLANFTAAL